MAYANQISVTPLLDSSTTDLLGRARVSIPTTVANYKNLYGATTSNQLFDFKGTGSVVYENGETSLRVTAGQYMVMQSKEYHYYVAGQPMRYDITGNHFHKFAGLVKRVGCFASNAVAPYDSNKDGIWFEANGVDDKYYFCIFRDNTEVVKQEIVPPVGYDFYNFNFLTIDYVWQGGKKIRLQGQLPDGTSHTFALINYAQNYHLAFCKNPYLPFRVEVRSTTGVGQIDFICCAVTRDDGAGTVELRQRNTPLTATTYSIGTIGTRYVLGALRKIASKREAFAQVSGMSVAITTSDTMFVEFVKNPTLTAGSLTYTALTESSLEYAQGNGSQTIGNTGINIGGGFVNNTTPLILQNNNLLSSLYGDLDNNMDVIMLIGTPITATISLTNTMSFNELL